MWFLAGRSCLVHLLCFEEASSWGRGRLNRVCPVPGGERKREREISLNPFLPSSLLYTFGSSCVYATLGKNGLKETTVAQWRARIWSRGKAGFLPPKILACAVCDLPPALFITFKIHTISEVPIRQPKDNTELISKDYIDRLVDTDHRDTDFSYVAPYLGL